MAHNDVTSNIAMISSVANVHFFHVEKFTVREIAIGQGRSIERPCSYEPLVQNQLDKLDLGELTG